MFPKVKKLRQTKQEESEGGRKENSSGGRYRTERVGTSPAKSRKGELEKSSCQKRR